MNYYCGFSGLHIRHDSKWLTNNLSAFSSRRFNPTKSLFGSRCCSAWCTALRAAQYSVFKRENTVHVIWRSRDLRGNHLAGIYAVSGKLAFRKMCTLGAQSLQVCRWAVMASSTATTRSRWPSNSSSISCALAELKASCARTNSSSSRLLSLHFIAVCLLI